MKTGEIMEAEENVEGGVDPKIVQDLRNEIEDQQQTIDKLREELENKSRPGTAQSFDWEDEKVGFELQLEQKDVRINALETE